ncbi:hypothetical protein TNCT_425601 [Trichonephila clavata]|uniref:Uncharacterized protein n=1 Tax=Trichonephila clavata TaxID=2740835 RepID=A0A8X6FQC5_TRICU|nr:hypothetical protein TNCT_425601 [Trichonephila clavata]
MKTREQLDNSEAMKIVFLPCVVVEIGLSSEGSVFISRPGHQMKWHADLVFFVEKFRIVLPTNRTSIRVLAEFSTKVLRLEATSLMESYWR